VPPPSLVPAQELFVLPEGFRGTFVAIYDQRDGQRISWAGDTAIVKVPSTGIVRLQYPEPPQQTLTAHVFGKRSAPHLRNYPTCADMRLAISDSIPAICWLDFEISLENTPENVVAVITTWDRLPQDYERMTAVYDSLLLGGKGIGKKKWEEPADPKRKRTQSRFTGGGFAGR
jgi:hypothetical protein